MKHPIICIPRISKYFSTADIRYIFNDYEFGNSDDWDDDWGGDWVIWPVYERGRDFDTGSGW